MRTSSHINCSHKGLLLMSSKVFNNMDRAMENAKLQHCCSCPELFIQRSRAFLFPSDSQTVGHKQNHQKLL